MEEYTSPRFLPVISTSKVFAPEEGMLLSTLKFKLPVISSSEPQSSGIISFMVAFRISTHWDPIVIALVLTAPLGQIPLLAPL